MALSVLSALARLNVDPWGEAARRSTVTTITESEEPMTDANSSDDPYTARWYALLAENSILHKTHLDLLSSFTRPFSAQQKVQLKASAARFESLPPRVQQLIEDWANSLGSEKVR
jgi:hypothetical protein